jgi:hypothetical protein
VCCMSVPFPATTAVVMRQLPHLQTFTAHLHRIPCFEPFAACLADLVLVALHAHCMRNDCHVLSHPDTIAFCCFLESLLCMALAVQCKLLKCCSLPRNLVYLHASGSTKQLST